MLAIDECRWEHGRRTTTDVGRGEKGCAVGASSDTPSHSQAAQVLDELRSIRRTIEGLERTMTELPSRTARARSERFSRRYELLIGIIGSAVLGLSLGLLAAVLLRRIVPALLGS
jgi:hypothetical protein